MNRSQKLSNHTPPSPGKTDDFHIDLADFLLVMLPENNDLDDYLLVPKMIEYKLPDCIWMQVVKVVDQNCVYVADSWLGSGEQMSPPIKIRREDMLAHKKFKPRIFQDHFDDLFYTPEFLKENQKMVDGLIA